MKNDSMLNVKCARSAVYPFYVYERSKRKILLAKEWPTSMKNMDEVTQFMKWKMDKLTNEIWMTIGNNVYSSGWKRNEHMSNDGIILFNMENDIMKWA
jgi:hypothetical protein